MEYSHDEIKEMLPDYLNGFLSEIVRSNIKAHLKECPDCIEEISFISEVMKTDPPDPGDLFWNTLPQKVSKIAAEKEEKMFSFNLLFRPAPVVFVSALLAAIIIFFPFHTRDTETTDIDLLFRDPMAFSTIDISGITEEDVASILEETIKENTTKIYYPEDFNPHSYQMEIASLSLEKMDILYEALKREEKKGG